MSVDIRSYTRLIIRKNSEYLQCKGGYSNSLIWSTSPWDAWWTRDKEEALLVARTVGGIAMIFNPASGQLMYL